MITSATRSFTFQFIIGLLMFGLLSFLMWKAAGSSGAPGPEPALNAAYTKVEDDTITRWPVLPSSVPALMVKKSAGDTASEPLRMAVLHIDVKVIGNIASTTMEMSFYNDLDRLLEGEFIFPLGEGQTVSRFAMDVNGNMREGVVVEKAKGRATFESVVRRKIDPGLLELTKGNNFRSRVYPIPAKGYKKITVSYEQELISSGRGQVYILPMGFKNKIDDFSVNVEVVKQETAPVLYENDLTNFKFEKWNESFIAKAHYENYMPSKQLAFALPLTGNESNTYVEKADAGEYYFYANVFPEKYSQPKKLLSSIGLVWDVSGSAASRDLDKELALLDAYFKQVNNAAITLIPFSNEVWPVAEYKLENGDWKKLKERLAGFRYDGGTQMGCLKFSDYKCEEFILSGDGLSNFGSTDVKLAAAPVMVINSAPSADHSFLSYLAMSSGGQYINLAKLTTAEAAGLLSEQPYRFISATYDNAQVSAAYPSIPSGFSHSFAFAGKLMAESADIMLNFGFGTTVVYSKKITVSKKDLSNTGLVQRMWAQKKLSELDLQFEKNKDEITALGKQLSIVTRNTSLIVLDRVEDYVEHRIVPPAELRKQYDEMIARIDDQKKSTEKEHIEQVVAMFKSRIEWWNKEFKYERSLEKRKSSQNGYNEDIMAAPGSSDSIVLQGSTVTISNGAAANYSYNWSPSSNNASPNGVIAGSYNVTVTDAYASTAENDVANKEKEDSDYKEADAKISIKAWDPEEPYMKKLKAAAKENAYTVYLDLKKQYGAVPSYYLDASDYFRSIKDNATALRVLSNIAELGLDDHRLMRVLAHRLEELKYYDLAIYTFKDVVKIREEEPQSYRDLGLAYAASGQDQQAVDMLYEVIKKSWDARFPEIELLAAGEMNNVIARTKSRLDLGNIDQRLIKNMPVDVRVVIDWDSDNCDMDLWVIDPQDETCMYSYPDTRSGGHISKDFTGGYGPEEFMIKKAATGSYKIKINFYGDHQQTIAGPTTVHARLITNYGRAGQKEQDITLRLKNAKDVVDIGELAFSPLN